MNEVSRPEVRRWLGDEGAAAGDPLEEALGDEGVERLAHGHAGHAEAGHELALGRGGGAGRLGLDEAPHVLAHLDVLECPLTRVRRASTGSMTL